MIDPGYYKTNYRALRLGEMMRWYGWKRGLKHYYKSRFMSAGAGAWMPGLWATTECKKEDLSDEFWNATKPHRGDFEKLGFVQCRLVKASTFNPLVRDRGGISYLDSSGRYFGQLIFLRVYHQSLRKEINDITIAFTTVFEHRSFTCTNAKKTYDPLAETEVLRLNSYDVNFIYQEFLKGLRQYNESPHIFPDVESLRQWFDDKQIKTLEERVRRGLFVRMTDREVAVAQARLRGGVAAAAPGFLSGFGWRGLVWLVIIGCILLRYFIQSQMPHVSHGRPDTIEYQGQEFKMRKVYETYEDYKDDPNNLDTNELDRIETTIVSARVPGTFKDRKEFVHFLFELEFPGYGVGGIGEFPKADDGTRLEVEAVEIPQKEKDRVLTLKQSGEQLILVDDFVYSTATNQISHVKLEDKVLHYYDGNNQLIREKPL